MLFRSGTGERRVIDGLQVSMSMPLPESGHLNIRFDTAEGTGSFGETLTRHGRAATKQAVRLASSPASARS